MSSKINYVFENVVVFNVVDGDTIDVLIDFGFKISQEVRLRLYGINAPETRGKEKEQGLKTKEFLMDLIEGETVKIKTYKKGKYGRYIADVYFKNKNVNKLLVRKKLAKVAHY